jgi:hypothetical protein
LREGGSTKHHAQEGGGEAGEDVEDEIFGEAVAGHGGLAGGQAVGRHAGYGYSYGTDLDHEQDQDQGQDEYRRRLCD